MLRRRRTNKLEAPINHISPPRSSSPGARWTLIKTRPQNGASRRRACSRRAVRGHLVNSAEDPPTRRRSTEKMGRRAPKTVHHIQQRSRRSSVKTRALLGFRMQRHQPAKTFASRVILRTIFAFARPARRPPPPPPPGLNIYVRPVSAL